MRSCPRPLLRRATTRVHTITLAALATSLRLPFATGPQHVKCMAPTTHPLDATPRPSPRPKVAQPAKGYPRCLHCPAAPRARFRVGCRRKAPPPSPSLPPCGATRRPRRQPPQTTRPFTDCGGTGRGGTPSGGVTARNAHSPAADPPRALLAYPNTAFPGCALLAPGTWHITGTMLDFCRS